MVIINPLLQGGLSSKINATVINDIWPGMLFFSLVATAVALVTGLTTVSLAISNQLLVVLGLALSLVISFRTSSAYERYQDGRKMWANIAVASRSLAQLIWIHVPNKRPTQNESKAMTELESIIEKKSMVNLVQALSVAEKHFLRGEGGIQHDDLYHLISFLPPYAAQEQAPNPSTSAERTIFGRDILLEPKQQAPSMMQASDNQSQTINGGPQSSLDRRLSDGDQEPLEKTQPAHLTVQVQQPPTIPDHKPAGRPQRRRTLLGRKKKPSLPESNIPLEITLFLSSYVSYLIQTPGLIQPAVATAMINNLGIFQDTLSNLERIVNTPLPFAYQAHLRVSVWLYLSLLPFQLVGAFGYLCIPGTAFASFLLLGFLEIGAEIENPFNYDANDLDIDSFCLAIQRELHQITAHTEPIPHHFVFSHHNHPFAPADRRTAKDLTSNGGVAEYVDKKHGTHRVKDTLLNCWKTIEAKIETKT